MRRWTIVVLAAGLALAAAACGSSGSSKASSTNATKASTPAKPTPVALTGKLNNKGTKDETAQGTNVTMSIEADDFYFEPTFVKVTPGAKVTLEIENNSKNQHTFTTQGMPLSIDQTLDPGQKQTVSFVVPGDGAVRFYCRFHGSMGMQGAFYTQDGQTVGGAPAAATASASKTTTTSKPKTTTTSSSGY